MNQPDERPDEQLHRSRKGPSPQCVGCYYDLRDLDPRGVCPECGLPIRRSLPRPPRVQTGPPPTLEQLELWKQQRAARGLLSLPSVAVVFALVGIGSMGYVGPIALVPTAISLLLIGIAVVSWQKQVWYTPRVVAAGLIVIACAITTAVFLVWTWAPWSSSPMGSGP